METSEEVIIKAINQLFDLVGKIIEIQKRQDKRADNIIELLEDLIKRPQLTER